MTTDHLASAIEKLTGVDLTIEEWQAVAAEVDTRLETVEGYGGKPGPDGVVVWDREFNYINWETLKTPHLGEGDILKPFIWGGDGP